MPILSTDYSDSGSDNTTFGMLFDPCANPYGTLTMIQQPSSNLGDASPSLIYRHVPASLREIVLVGEIDGLTVGNAYFYNCEMLTSVTVSEGITQIPNQPLSPSHALRGDQFLRG
ncbi:MAG: hypothetical protein EZS28_054226, partial [Streblomastix strix]